MPKYHFEIVDGYRLEDPVGVELPGTNDAKSVAHDIAKQIAIDVAGNSERNVVVVDDDGTEVYKTPITEEDAP